MNSQETRRSYRFGFVLTTAAGNMTRYQNLRKYAERDAEVECAWAPIKHYLNPDPFRHWPGPLRTRAIVMREAEPVLSQFNRLDAIMFHAFEPYVASILRNGGRKKPLIAWSQDNPPVSDPRTHPQYGGSKFRSEWQRRLRYNFDVYCARRVDLFFPFSKWAGDVLTNDCGVSVDKVYAIHVGLDLELWPYVPKTNMSAKARPQILFVGGDFVRKGGDLLLRVFRQHFAGTADLHLVTKEPPSDLPPGVQVSTDLSANDPRLRQLYADADLFVLPTRADVSSWVAMEAMATGRPVITTNTGGIPDIVQDGRTGFVISPDDGAALTARMRALLDDAALRRRMGEAGRRVIEQDFDAAVCVPRILGTMKDAVDAVRPPVHPQIGATV